MTVELLIPPIEAAIAAIKAGRVLLGIASGEHGRPMLTEAAVQLETALLTVLLADKNPTGDDDLLIGLLRERLRDPEEAAG